MTDPSLIVLDEPTSGLDSFKALGIVKTLHKLAREKGKTIIATIHQPSSEALEYFDKLILMAEGHVLFQGSVMRSKQYFESIGHKIKPHSNPVDNYMRLLTVNYPKK